MNINFEWQTINGNQSDFIFDADKITFVDNYITLTDPSDTTNPSITTNTGISYTFINRFLVSYDEYSSNSIIKFQISNDNYNWYYYDSNNSEWKNSNLLPASTVAVSGTNRPSELTEDVISEFPFEIGDGLFYWKAYFISDGVSQPPRISAVNFVGEKYYSSPKKVKDLMKAFGLRQIDPITGEFCETGDYLSNEKLKGWIPLADAYINSKTFTDFYYHRDVVEYYDGNGKDSLRTYNYPLKKLTHVIMYNPLMQAMRTFLDFELIIHPQWGEIFLPPIYPAFLSDSPARSLFGNIFIKGRRNIEIKYDWGHETTPEDISLAASKYIGTQIMSAYWANLTRGSISRSFDGYGESFGNKPFAGIVEMWEKEIQTVIINNRKVFPRSI